MQEIAADHGRSVSVTNCGLIAELIYRSEAVNFCQAATETLSAAPSRLAGVADQDHAALSEVTGPLRPTCAKSSRAFRTPARITATQTHHELLPSIQQMRELRAFTVLNPTRSYILATNLKTDRR